ncbi:MAG: hypothetical protein V7K41_19595 [Nostoc sp.]|uniref:hypothetical protein n=1 Tax=Nostoc sp. TaxID=1180 RepID=UPI002FF98909
MHCSFLTRIERRVNDLTEPTVTKTKAAVSRTGDTVRAAGSNQASRATSSCADIRTARFGRSQLCFGCGDSRYWRSARSSIALCFDANFYQSHCRCFG